MSDLRGDVDQRRLEGAFRSVISRHDILRSSYRHNSSGVFQTIHDDAEFSLQLLDLRDCEDKEKLCRTNKAVADFGAAPFHLGCPCALPMQAVLIWLGQEHFRLVITAHHIAMDGLSWEILYAELSAAFAGDPLPRLAIQRRFLRMEGKIPAQ